MAHISKPDFDKDAGKISEAAGEGPSRPRHASRATPIVDWLGATKPLHLIAGACGIIGLLAWLAEALG